MFVRKASIFFHAFSCHLEVIVLCCSQLYYIRKDRSLTKDAVKHVINRILHDLRWYMLFVEVVVCFLPPRQGLGVENTKLIGSKTCTIAKYERSYINMISTQTYYKHQHVLIS